jgi:hypothetical protein
MFSGTIAAWQRAVPGQPVDTPDAHKERERIYFEWQPRGVTHRAGVEDDFREAARNPGGSIRPLENDPLPGRMGRPTKKTAPYASKRSRPTTSCTSCGTPRPAT